jgi:hypothetical protein
MTTTNDLTSRPWPHHELPSEYGSRCEYDLQSWPCDAVVYRDLAQQLAAALNEQWAHVNGDRLDRCRSPCCQTIAAFLARAGVATVEGDG